MNTEPKISIIVPVYNAEKYLCKCIESILSQTLTNFELLLINDGSKDNSGQICEDYAKNDTRIKVIHQSNRGVSAARNKGLDVAIGDCIGFVDSDDYISSEMYENLFSALNDYNADIAECGYIVTDANYKVTKKISFKNEKISGNYDCVYNFLTNRNTTNFSFNKIFKRFLFEDIRYPNLKFSEDYVVNAKAFYKCNKKVTISGCFYYYVRNPDSACHQEFNESKMDTIKAGKEVLDFYEHRFPILSKFVIIYILNKIRNLYVDIIDSNISDKKKHKENLVNEYKIKYSLIEGNIEKTVCCRSRSIALWIFNKSPYFYYIIDKIKRKLVDSVRL